MQLAGHFWPIEARATTLDLSPYRPPQPEFDTLRREMLIGRTEEIAKLDALLDQVRDGMSGVLVLRGEAGIGKTALLNATTLSAQDLSVTRLEGIESEMQLGYAALHRLLLPYLPRLQQLPEPQRDALQSAFGLTSSAPPRPIPGQPGRAQPPR